MFRFVRAGLAAAFLAFVLSTAIAADKPLKQSALDEAAIKLEAQIKSDAGTVTKPSAALKRDADAAFQKNDFRSGMLVLGQLVAVAPDDASSWLRLARTILQIKPRDDREKALLLDRASTAAYIAYVRAGDRALESDSLSVLGRALADRQQWRGALDAMRASLDLREAADLRGQYEKLRAEYGFRLLDFTVDADSISPRACFQFSEELPGRRTDFSPFVAVAGMDRPAISTNEKQLCVEELKHGERYSMTLRAGLPSVVKETLPKSSEFTIFVRDRKPFVRFSGKAYVLPRMGQKGIPVLSVNTQAVVLAIYRIGDRNLLDSLLGYEFQRNMSRYQSERLASERGAKIWNGELAVESKLNTEVTTAFPLDQAVKDLAPGLYAMTAEPKDVVSTEYGQQATQWFIVSDLGLSAYTTHDGIDVFIHSLASADPRSSVEVRLIARNNEVLAVRQTDRNGFIHFEAGLARGEGGVAPAAIVASEKGDYAFLSLKSPAFDLSDRGVAGRAVPAGLDAFVYTERGVYRSGETVAVTALLRDARGVAAANAPLTLVITRPDGVEYRRALVADQGLGGRSMSVPLVSSASTGTWRVAAYTDPKRPSVGETTFMVEDYVPDRLEFDLSSAAKSISRVAPAQISVDGRFLYGAPASNLELSGELTIAAAKELPGFPGYAFGLFDDEVTPVRQELDDVPNTDAAGKAKFPVALNSTPASSRPLEAQITVRMAESGGRAVERKLTLPVASDSAMLGVKPMFSGRSLADGANADFDVIMLSPDGKDASEKRRPLRSAQGREQLSVVPPERPMGIRAGQTNGTRSQRHCRYCHRQAGTPVSSRQVGALPSGSVDGRSQRSHHISELRRRFLCRSECRYAGSSGSCPRQTRLQAGRGHECSDDRAHSRPADDQRFHRSSCRQSVAGRESGRDPRQHNRRPRLGHRCLHGCDLASCARCAGTTHARPRDRGAVVLDRSGGAHFVARHENAGDDAAELATDGADQAERTLER